MVVFQANIRKKKASHVVWVRINPEQYAELRKLAEAESRTLVSLVRHSIKELLAKKKAG